MKKKPSGDTLDRALTDLYQADVPAGYQAAWRDAVKREEPSPMKSNPQLTWLRRAALPIAAAAVLIIGTAVTGFISPRTPQTVSDEGTYSLTTNAYKAYEPAPEPGYDLAGVVYGTNETIYDDETNEAYAQTASTRSGGAQVADGAETADRKIIRTLDLTLSSTAFDADYDAILALAQAAGGYAGSVSLYGQTDQRTASFSLRIPAEALDSFLSDLAGVGRVTDRYETADDLTTQYTDTELRLKTQQDKMTRLQELLLAAETVEDLLNIESEIADTQYTIDSLQTSLRSIDRRVDYATVNVYLREETPGDTAAAEDLTIGERLLSSLKASLNWLGGFFENMLVFLTAAAPVLVPLAVVIIIVYAVRKRRKPKQ